MKIPEALGLAPSYADLFSKSLAALPIGKVSKTLEKSIFDGVMSFGLKQLRVTGQVNLILLRQNVKNELKIFYGVAMVCIYYFQLTSWGFNTTQGRWQSPKIQKIM